MTLRRHDPCYAQRWDDECGGDLGFIVRSRRALEPKP